MAATEAISTPTRAGGLISVPVAAAATIYQGTLVGVLTTAGTASPAADAANTKVLGFAEADVDNSAGAAGDLDVVVNTDVAAFANSATNPVAADDLLADVYVEDDETVSTDGGTNNVVAGQFIGLDPETDKVWVRFKKSN